MDPLYSSAPPEYSPNQREEIQKYILKHPEIKEIIEKMMSKLLKAKPEDPIEFIAEYFNEKKNDK